MFVLKTYIILVVLNFQWVFEVKARPQFPPVHAEQHFFNATNNTKTEKNNKIATSESLRILHYPRNRSRGDLSEEDMFGDQDIVFPDSYEVVFEPIARIDHTPKCAGDATFCENFENYPHQHLRDVLQKTRGHNDLFGTDEAPPEIANRIGEVEDTFICASVDRTIFPKVGKNKNNKWKYIINQGAQEGYVQGVRIETCKRLNGPCDLLGDAPNGYVTTCKQKYVYRRLLSLTDVGQPIPDTFLMPSACCCSYKRDLNYLSNFGRSTTPIKRR